MTRAKILLTRPFPPQSQAWLVEHFDATVNDGAPLTPAELTAAMTEYDALCTSITDKMTAEVFATPGARVRLVANFGVGYEHIDVAAAKTVGITVTNTPDVLTEATADIAVMLMLMAARRASEGERNLRAGLWKGWGAKSMLGQSPEGKTLGLAGFGRIGQETARKARAAFGMAILYHSRRRAAPEIEAAHDAEYVETLDELAARSDVLSLHMPGGAETRHMVGARVLRLMKPTAILVNTARGSVVDEAALAAALKAGTIWAAGLDVYEHEPEVHPALLEIDNAVLLPHLGSATIETREAMGMRVAANVDAFFSGEPVRDRVA